ncbi:MAG: EmrB/QacA family drug resistance transporter [Candidatus Tectimicrobiota bacterium]|nr:MAG: EmrB/QacA family drug resistance transporter [Candidatus Tectomicrobia bacterium]
MNRTRMPSPGTPAAKWLIAATVVLGSFVSVMDISIVNVAMPQMLGTFGVSLDAITWVAVAYSIAEIILVTMSAWFSVLLGRKRFYLFSFLLFTGASALCGAARSLEMMILARVLQGIGGGGLIPVAQAIMLETFPEEERGMAMALYMMGVVVAPAVGPVLGGWLTDHYGWPWIFYINLPVGVLGMAMAAAVLHDPPYLQRTLARIDWVGIGLLAVGLTALQLFLERGEREDWFASRFIVVAALVALLALAALVWWELRAEEPVVNLRVLKNVPFLAGTSMGFIFGITLFGSIFILPLFLQQLRGYSVFDSGLIQMPRALAMLVLAPLAGRLYNLVDSRLLVGGGIVLMMVGYFDMAHYTLEVGGAQMLPALVLTGSGMAFMFSVMSAASMRTMPPRLLTAASGLYTLARRVGGNLGYALVATLVAQRTAFHRARLVEHVTPYDEPTWRALAALGERLAGGGMPPGVDTDAALKLLDRAVHRQATMLAYNDVFWVMAMLFVLSFPFLLLLGRRRRAVPRPVASRS